MYTEWHGYTYIHRCNGMYITMIVLSLFVEFDKIDATKSSFCRFLSKLTKTLLYGSTWQKVGAVFVTFCRFFVNFCHQLSQWINGLNETIISIKAKVIDSCIEVIIGRPVIRSHHLVRKIPSYFDEVESRCQSNQEARPVSTPVCNACHSCAHPRCQHSHAKQMGIDTDRGSIWITRSDQSPDPIDGKVCPICQLTATWDIRFHRKRRRAGFHRRWWWHRMAR